MKVIKEIFKYLLRLISLVFLAPIVLIALLRQFFKFCYMYLCFGGEVIAYSEKNANKNINDVYHRLETFLKVELNQNK